MNLRWNHDTIDFVLWRKHMRKGKVIFEILIGNAILAFAIAVFILPNQMICGGVTGLSIILAHYLHIDISISVWMLNIILFLAGAFVLGKKFAMTTIISTFVFPTFLTLFQMIPNLDAWNQDILLSALCAGVLTGAGIGIVIKNGASTGGMDIPPLIIHKKAGLSISICLYVMDTCILLLQALFSEPMMILYGVMIVLLTSLVLNKVVLNGHQQVQIFIISNAYQKIKEDILHKADNGVTLFDITSGYEEKELKGIMCITSNRKLHAINETITSNDPEAFYTISNINEVKGKGFTIER